MIQGYMSANVARSQERTTGTKVVGTRKLKAKLCFADSQNWKISYFLMHSFALPETKWNFINRADYVPKYTI